MANILDTNRQIVDAIRNLAFSACCPDIPLTDQPTQETDILPGVGDPPATWGTEPVVDWDDWERLVCGYANGWIDRQISNANLVQTLITTGTLTVALIVGIMFVIGLTVISMGTAAGIWGGIGALYGTFVFSAAATAFTDNRDEIICKILTDEGVGEFRDYMQSIIPPLAWAGFYTWLDYQHIINSIWEGQNPDGSLEVTRMDCPTCDDPNLYDFDTTFYRTSTPLWDLVRIFDTVEMGNAWEHLPRSSGNLQSHQRLLRDDLLARIEAPAGYRANLKRIDVDVSMGSSYLPKTGRIVWYNGDVSSPEITDMPIANGVRTIFTAYRTSELNHVSPEGYWLRIEGRHNNGDNTTGSDRMYIWSVRVRGILTLIE